MKPIILENYTIDGYQGFGIKLFTYVKEISLAGKYILKNFFIPGLFPVYGKGNLEWVLLINLLISFFLEGGEEEGFR